MDQIRIGKFITEERKRKGYTQRKLAEQLGISDKTISKWERGNGFPEVSLLLPLCEELEITVNELLVGESSQGGISRESGGKYGEFINGSTREQKENSIICNDSRIDLAASPDINYHFRCACYGKLDTGNFD